MLSDFQLHSWHGSQSSAVLSSALSMCKESDSITCQINSSSLMRAHVIDALPTAVGPGQYKVLGPFVNVFLHEEKSKYLANYILIYVLILPVRYSILPGLSLNGILHLDIVEGSYDAAKFGEFINGLLSWMNPYPGPNSVIVMDNCRIHKLPWILEMILERFVSAFDIQTSNWTVSLEEWDTYSCHHTPRTSTPLKMPSRPSKCIFGGMESYTAGAVSQATLTYTASCMRLSILWHPLMQLDGSATADISECRMLTYLTVFGHAASKGCSGLFFLPCFDPCDISSVRICSVYLL